MERRGTRGADLLTAPGRHPPGARPPMTSGVSVRPAALGDLERIAWLEETCFLDPWPAPYLRAELVQPGAILLVAGTESANVAGYASLRHGAGEAELLRVAVAPDLRHQGVATALVETGLARVARAGAQRCFLEVREANAAARQLYERLGFASAGRRLRYYRDGSDAVLYAITLPLSGLPGTIDAG
jgi:ribosomal-protein-alanine N-acetyltransferase